MKSFRFLSQSDLTDTKIPAFKHTADDTTNAPQCLMTNIAYTMATPTTLESKANGNYKHSDYTNQAVMANTIGITLYTKNVKGSAGGNI